MTGLAPLNLLLADAKKNVSRGRTFFGFESVGRGRSDPGYTRDPHGCEEEVDPAARASAIIREDRALKPGDL
jgi:hypothetical protein